MSKITLLHPPTLKLQRAKRFELYEILPPIASKAATKMKLRLRFGRNLANVKTVFPVFADYPVKILPHRNLPPPCARFSPN